MTKGADAVPVEQLRLLAFDVDDLAVLSAHLQDALIPVAEMAYLTRQRRFALVGRRFDWVKKSAGGPCERCATGFHFEGVLHVARSGFTPDETDRVLNLLAIEFAPGDLPAGTITITFSGGAALRLDVECLEAHLADLGPRWPCSCEPKHDVVTSESE
jgi:hypothetical protein